MRCKNLHAEDSGDPVQIRAAKTFTTIELTRVAQPAAHPECGITGIDRAPHALRSDLLLTRNAGLVPLSPRKLPSPIVRRAQDIGRSL